MIGYSQQTKQQILDDLKQSGLSVNEAAKKHRVCPQTLYRWLQDGSQGQTNIRQALKENKSLKTEVEVLTKLIKRLSAGAKKIPNRPPQRINEL